MDKADFQGVFGIVPTPLTAVGEIDEDGLGHLVGHCAKSGLHAAVVLGSNSEFPYFDLDEKKRVIEVAGKAADGKMPLVAGVGSWGTDESVTLARHAGEHGYGAVLAALPAYFKLGMADVVGHYRVLAKDGGLPVLYYHYPEVTGLDLSPDEMAEIAAIDGVVGAKITTTNRSLFKRVVKSTRTHLWSVFVGTTFLLRYALKRDGAGALCPLPLVAPKQCLELYDVMQKGDLDEADKIQDHLLGAIPLFSGLDVDNSVSIPFFKALSRKPYTGPGDRPAFTVALLKEALRLQGHPITSVTRRPCPPLTHQQADLVRKTMEGLGWA